MVAFLVQALVVVRALGSSRLVSGFAYLAVGLLHAGPFRIATPAINRTVQFNTASAPLVMAASFACVAAAKH